MARKPEGREMSALASCARKGILWPVLGEVEVRSCGREIGGGGRNASGLRSERLVLMSTGRLQGWDREKSKYGGRAWDIGGVGAFEILLEVD